MPTADIQVYEAAGRNRLSVSAWADMWRELVDYRELVHRLLSRNVAGQFRQSLLGYLWIALPPVASALVFTVLRAASVVNVPMAESSMPYALFALVGTTIWGFFTQVCMMGTTSLSNAGNLVSRVYFPREILVVSSAGNAVVNLAIRAAVVAISFLALTYVPHWQVVFAPLVLVPLAAFGLGLALFLAPLNTMMNDVSRILEFAFQFGLFLAPAVYPTPSLASARTGWEQALYWMHTLNPVSHFIHAVDALIETGTWMPDAGYLVATCVSFLTLALGWRFFHICEPFVAERL